MRLNLTSVTDFSDEEEVLKSLTKREEGGGKERFVGESGGLD